MGACKKKAGGSMSKKLWIAGGNVSSLRAVRYKNHYPQARPVCVYEQYSGQASGVKK